LFLHHSSRVRLLRSPRAPGPPQRRSTRKAIHLTVADPDLSTPELIVERAVASLRAGDTRYAETAGRPRLRRAIAERHELLSGRPTAAENVLLAPGAQCALYLAVRSLAGPGDHLVAIDPYYVNYPATLAASGAEVGSSAPIRTATFA
jgi:aspartate/methionine/tyrosine aminotransferase